MSKRILSGVVVSSNSNKTIVVEVTRRENINCTKKLLKEQKNIMLTMKIILIKKEIQLQFKKQNLFQN